MRKSLLILLMLVASLVACSPTDNDVTPEPVVIVETVIVVATPEDTVEPTVEVTEEPTVVVIPEDTSTPEPTVNPNAWRYVCGTANMETGVFRPSYDKRGDMRFNDAGNMIFKVVPRTEVAHYVKGETVCMYFDPFQVDNMKVTQVTGKGSPWFIPTFRVDFDRPVNPNP